MEWRLKTAAVLTGLYASLGFSVGASPYSEAVNRVVSPKGFAESKILWEALGLELSLLVFTPFLVLFLYGAAIGEWENENYWLLLVIGSASAFLMLVAFPFLVPAL